MIHGCSTGGGADSGLAVKRSRCFLTLDSGDAGVNTSHVFRTGNRSRVRTDKPLMNTDERSSSRNSREPIAAPRPSATQGREWLPGQYSGSYNGLAEWQVTQTENSVIEVATERTESHDKSDRRAQTRIRRLVVFLRASGGQRRMIGPGT